MSRPRWTQGFSRLLLTAAFSSSWAWAQPYTCPEGRFSAALSSATGRTESCSESPLGAITTYIYLDRQPRRTLTVSYTDLPKLALLAGREHIFEQSRQGMLAQCQGILCNWEKPDRNSRRLTYRVEGPTRYRGETHFKLDQMRLYVIDVRSEIGVEPEIDRNFLQSFKILPPPAAAAPAPHPDRAPQDR